MVSFKSAGVLVTFLILFWPNQGFSSCPKYFPDRSISADGAGVSDNMIGAIIMAKSNCFLDFFQDLLMEERERDGNRQLCEDFNHGPFECRFGSEPDHRGCVVGKCWNYSGGKKCTYVHGEGGNELNDLNNLSWETGSCEGADYFPGQEGEYECEADGRVNHTRYTCIQKKHKGDAFH